MSDQEGARLHESAPVKAGVERRVQQKLVAVNSWPFLAWLTSNDSGEGWQTFSLMLFNSGVGPVKLERLVVRFDGEPVRGWVELLQACCGLSPDFTRKDFQEIGFVSARLELSFDACYCSTAGECWQSELETLDPRRVGESEASPDNYLEVGTGLDDAPLPVIEPPRDAEMPGR